jgi:hypothetical protein
MQINRTLADKTFDHIDHALGRPLDPMAETYRNFFTTDGPLADEFAASPLWIEGRRGTGMRCFAVTDEGRSALAQYLRDVGDLHRAYTVTVDGNPRTVIAINHSKARYSTFLDLREVWPDLTFKDFCRRTTVRLVPVSSGNQT